MHRQHIYELLYIVFITCPVLHIYIYIAFCFVFVEANRVLANVKIAAPCTRDMDKEIMEIKSLI